MNLLFINQNIVQLLAGISELLCAITFNIQLLSLIIYNDELVDCIDTMEDLWEKIKRTESKTRKLQLAKAEYEMRILFKTSFYGYFLAGFNYIWTSILTYMLQKYILLQNVEYNYLINNL